MYQPFVEEEMVGEVDPDHIPGAVTVLRGKTQGCFRTRACLIGRDEKIDEIVTGAFCWIYVCLISFRACLSQNGF
jgi:hypothetical protein